MSDPRDITRQMKRLPTGDQVKVAAFVDFLRVGVPAPPTEGTPEHAAWLEKHADKFPELKAKLARCIAIGEGI